MAAIPPLAKTRAAGRMQAWLARLLWWAMAALVVPAWAQEDPPGRVGRVTEGQGQSWFFDADAGEWVALERNRPLTTGERIAVDDGARLELRIGSTAVRLAAGSELEITRLDDQRIELVLHDGSVAVRVRSPEVAREVQLTSAMGRFWLQGPGYFRVDRRDDGNVATAWQGDLHFDGDDSALDIPAGRSAELWREGDKDATHYRWREPSNDEFADWAARADREDDRVAVSPYVSPEMTGAEDLNRYGTWETTSDYGPLWIPTTVVAGWAPYRYGYWAWVRPWGWSWVDQAPWGFAPFHYGRWVHFGGRWCWAPGQRVLRPVYSPALVAWVGTGAPGPWPYVGWVPLAPREPYYPHYAHGGGYWRAVNAGQMKMFPPGTPRRQPGAPALYANQGVAGGVSVVPGRDLVPRRPVAPVVAQVDPGIRHNFATQPTRTLLPPPGVARPIAVPGTAPTPRPPGRSPTPAVMTPSPGGVSDWRRAPRAPHLSTTPTPESPRATIAPRGPKPPQSGEPKTSPPPRTTAPTWPSDPQVAPTRPAAPPAPAVRAPAPQPQPEDPRGPRRSDPGDSVAPRSPGRSSMLPAVPPQARAMPSPQARTMPSPQARRAERPAPPPEARREAVRPRDPHAAEARVRVPEWRGHPSRAQAR